MRPLLLLPLLAACVPQPPQGTPVPPPDPDRPRFRIPARHPDAPAVDLVVWLPAVVPALTPAGPRPVPPTAEPGTVTWEGAGGDGDLTVLLAEGPPADPATAGPRRWTGRQELVAGDTAVVRGMGAFEVTEVQDRAARLKGPTTELTLPPGTNAAWVLAEPDAAEARRALAVLRLDEVPVDDRPEDVRKREVDDVLRHGTLLERAQALRRVWTLSDRDYRPRRQARELEADLLPLLAPHAGQSVEALRKALHAGVGFDNSLPDGMTPEGPPQDTAGDKE